MGHKDSRKNFNTLLGKLRECGLEITHEYLELQDSDSRAEVHFKEGKDVGQFISYIAEISSNYEKVDISVETAGPGDYHFKITPLEHKGRRKIINEVMITLTRSLQGYIFQHKKDNQVSD